MTLDKQAALEREFQVLGTLFAQADLRLDRRAPEPFRLGYVSYAGPREQGSYYVKKWLSLRLSAALRDMVVDPTVTPAFLERCTLGRCPVTLVRFSYGGQSPRNPSVDRLVNEVTYRAGNICVLSQKANRAKGDKSFEEVLDIAQAWQGRDGLEPIEWARLCSLMYGAWATALHQGDPHPMPLAAIPGPGMFTTTSQVVQLLLMRACEEGTESNAAEFWRRKTIDAGAPESSITVLFDELRRAMAAKAAHPADSWLENAVFGAFERWYRQCWRTVVPALESSLSALQRLRNDPAATATWSMREPANTLPKSRQRNEVTPFAPGH